MAVKPITLVMIPLLLGAQLAHADPLPSWNSGAAKARIVEFVESVTNAAGASFVPRERRIAVFDNDGTLWSEKPVYFQFLYAMERMSELAEDDPSVLKSDVLRAAAAGDIGGALAEGHEGLIQIMTTSHSGLTVQEFQASVRGWLKKARHPTKGRPYAELIYQPMLELLRYLRDEGFATYIVSGGGIHFIRVFAQDVYGIPPENVIGSVGEASYQVRDGRPVIMKDSGIAFLDDKAAKPVAIDRKIGRRPIFVAGNSDGDFEMLEWATAGEGLRLGLIVHHTDAQREWAYDRESKVGRLDRGLDEAPGRGWLLVDMKETWRVIYPKAD